MTDEPRIIRDFAAFPESLRAVGVGEGLKGYPSAQVDYKQVGLLVDGVEFIPQDIVDKHMPFAVPPGTEVQAVFVEVPHA